MITAVFLDLDKTICSSKSEKIFGMYLLKKKEISLGAAWTGFSNYLKYDLGILKNYEDAKRRSMSKMFQGKSATRVFEMYTQCYKRHLQQNIYNEISKHIKEHQSKQREVFVISAAVDFAVKPFCDQLNIKQYYATSMEINNDIFTGKIVGDIPYGKMKGVIVKTIAASQNIDLASSYAYGDHISDRYMLEAVGHSIVVNPSNKLKILAKKNGWDILQTQKQNRM